jgi:hypothetical protein
MTSSLKRAWSASSTGTAIPGEILCRHQLIFACGATCRRDRRPALYGRDRDAWRGRTDDSRVSRVGHPRGRSRLPRLRARQDRRAVIMTCATGWPRCASGLPRPAKPTAHFAGTKRGGRRRLPLRLRPNALDAGRWRWWTPRRSRRSLNVRSPDPGSCLRVVLRRLRGGQNCGSGHSSRREGSARRAVNCFATSFHWLSRA